MYMAGVMIEHFAIYPALQVCRKPVIIEVSAPERAIGDASLRQACVQIEQADETRPFSAPFRNCKDRSLMVDQPGKNVVAVLPNGFHHNNGIRWNILEDLHPMLLAFDETMALDRVEFTAPPNRNDKSGCRAYDSLFRSQLCRPCLLVGK